MNLYKCDNCHNTFISTLDEIYSCKFCKTAGMVKKFDIDLMKPNIVSILRDPSTVRKLTDQELPTDHLKMHQIYVVLRRLGKYENSKTKGVSVEDVVNAHIFIVEEMERRKMNHTNKGDLDRDTAKIRNKKIKSLEWGDITLVEDVVSVVGSALYKDKPNDIDVICKFSDLPIIEEKIKEIVKQKEGLCTHLIKGEAHGEYIPKYDLVLKERKPEIKINKTIDYRELFMPLQYKEKTLNTDKFVIEPYLKARRLMIYRKDGNVEIFLGNGTRILDKKLVERINMINEPTDFIIDTLQLKNGTLVIQDILAKDNCNLLDDPLLSRKTFIWKMKIPRQAGIAFIKFKYCKNSEELRKEIEQYKIKKSSCILKPAFSTYKSKTGWLKLSYEEPIKLDLGCGQRKKKGYLGVDKVGYPNVDVKHDCSDGIPLDDNSCSIVRMNHSAEHFADPKFLMEEVYRVLKNDGIVVMTVPEASTYGAQKHPDHKSFWTENDINYFVNEDLIKKFEINCHFKLLKFFKRDFYTNNIHRIHLSWILQKSIESSKKDKIEFVELLPGTYECAIHLEAEKKWVRNGITTFDTPQKGYVFDIFEGRKIIRCGVDGYYFEPIKKSYFISEKPIYGNLDDMIKMVRKIGSKWCVLHGHPPKSPTDKPIGSVIKCFPTKEQAEKMHQAILISQARESGAFKRKKIMIRKYGTSEGASRAWDTRGRGRNTESTSGKISTEHEQKIREYVTNNKIGEYVGIQYGLDNKPELVLYNDEQHSTHAIAWNNLPPELQKMETVPVMTEVIRHPTQFITEKPKRKIKVVIRRRKVIE